MTWALPPSLVKGCNTPVDLKVCLPCKTFNMQESSNQQRPFYLYFRITVRDFNQSQFLSDDIIDKCKPTCTMRRCEAFRSKHCKWAHFSPRTGVWMRWCVKGPREIHIFRLNMFNSLQLFHWETCLTLWLLPLLPCLM